MADLVNLRTVRKRRARAEREAAAAEARTLHGRTKAEKDLERARADKGRRDLEAHRRDERSD